MRKLFFLFILSILLIGCAGRRHINKAREYISFKNYEEAQTELHKAIKTNASDKSLNAIYNEEAYYLLGWIAGVKENYTKMMDYYKKANEISNNYSTYIQESKNHHWSRTQNKGINAFEAKKYKIALAHFRLAQKIKPYNEKTSKYLEACKKGIKSKERKAHESTINKLKKVTGAWISPENKTFLIIKENDNNLFIFDNENGQYLGKINDGKLKSELNNIETIIKPNSNNTLVVNFKDYSNGRVVFHRPDNSHKLSGTYYEKNDQNTIYRFYNNNIYKVWDLEYGNSLDLFGVYELSDNKITTYSRRKGWYDDPPPVSSLKVDFAEPIEYYENKEKIQLKDDKIILRDKILLKNSKSFENIFFRKHPDDKGIDNRKPEEIATDFFLSILSKNVKRARKFVLDKHDQEILEERKDGKDLPIDSNSLTEDPLFSVKIDETNHRAIADLKNLKRFIDNYKLKMVKINNIWWITDD